ncbi:MAG: TrkH family potassium uptake protein [bacterium]
MQLWIEKLLRRLLIVAAILAGLSLITEYGFYVPERLVHILTRIDVGIIVFFISETVIRLLISHSKRFYLRAHWADFALIAFFFSQLIALARFGDSRFVSELLGKLDIRSVTKGYILLVQVYIGGVLFIKTIYANRLIARLNLTPPQMVLLSFGLLILFGTMLLLLPRATRTGHSMPFIDALFTATSATCVTGLVVVDTGSYFTHFGQGIVLLLIQLGGIGIMSLVAFSSVAIGRGVGMRERAMLKDILSPDFVIEVTSLIKLIVVTTGLFEIIGVIILSRIWAEDFPSPITTLYYSIFHSISAFCNAGFSLFSDSLRRFAFRGGVIITFSMLIISGGLGFMVISEVAHWFYRRILKRDQMVRLSLHTRIVLFASLALILIGTSAIFVLEHGELTTVGGLRNSLLNAFFTSVTARTAGFSTVSIGSLTVPAAMVLMALMFIGASPGGTGGGVKTSSAAVLLATVRSILRRRANVEILRRTLPQDIVNKAICVVLLSLGLVFISALAISAIDGSSLTDVVFESISAFGTVGLSRGITGSLTNASKIVIIATMFLGRIGPLTLGLAIGHRLMEAPYSYPAEKVLIG